MMKHICKAVLGLVLAAVASSAIAGDPTSPSSAAFDKPAVSYCIVDTGQQLCFSDRAQLRAAPRTGEAFHGQDCYYQGPAARYVDNKDGTISDLNTGLMWQKAPDGGGKLTFAQFLAAPKNCRTGGYTDWRAPTIKELYSLIDFNGNCRTNPPVAYIDTKYFKFTYGDADKGERIIDSQYWSSTQYVGRTMDNAPTVFGVNFADGRIKGYPRDRGPGGGAAVHYGMLVRCNSDYGKNNFVDNGDGTVSDLATGLMWTKADSGKGLDWRGALAWCENLKLAGHDDWRLPNAKELQSIVDYTRAPDATDASGRGPAIDPVFSMTSGEGWFWTGTTHLEGGRTPGEEAIYVAFGRAMGHMPNPRTGPRHYLNVHGAGAQRSDPKSGDPRSPQWSSGRGPQGDEIRIHNFARAVRNIDPQTVQPGRIDLTPLPASARGTAPPGSPPGIRRDRMER
ncbi:MAG: hypothetical protein BIFFINMI_00539 [Phycisphaerae bacterium]|nr:hypothetical protein [Phycisphaerae bacterium]